jgi:hypothetical protein
MAKDRKRSPEKTSRLRGWLGCLPQVFVLIGAIVLGILVIRLLLMPWAYHIGGQSFPSTQWTGFGRLHSTTGQDQGLYIEIGGVLWSEPKGVARWKLNPGYAGTASVCGPKGERFILDLSGGAPRSASPWLSTDGTQVLLNLAPPQGAPGSMRFDLSGEWKGSDLAVADRKPGQHAEWVLKPGSYSEFQKLCEALK